MLHTREVDNSGPTESPLRQVASDAYRPESREVFTNKFTQSSCHNERMSDDALNTFFKSNIDTSQLYKSCEKPGEQHTSNDRRSQNQEAFNSFDSGTDHYKNTTKHLREALAALNSDNPNKALKELGTSKNCLDNGNGDIKNGLDKHEGTCGESPIQQGLERAKKNDFAIKAASELIKGGCTEDAKHVIRDAIKRINGASSEVSEGVQNLRTPEQSGYNSRDNHGQHRRGDGNSSDRISYRPFDGQEKPPIKPGEFLVILVNGTSEGLRNSANLLGRLLGSGFSGNGYQSDSSRSSSDSFNPMDPLGLFKNFDSSIGNNQAGGDGGLLSALPKPPDPLGLLGSGNGSLLDSLPKPPNSLAILGGGDGGVLSSLPKPPDPLGILGGGNGGLLDSLPKPPNLLGGLGGGDSAFGNLLPTNPIEAATKPLELASKPLELATKPLEPLKKLFKKLF